MRPVSPKLVPPPTFAAFLVSRAQVKSNFSSKEGGGRRKLAMTWKAQEATRKAQRYTMDIVEARKCQLTNITRSNSSKEEKGTTEDEMAGWHHGLDGHESE